MKRAGQRGGRRRPTGDPQVEGEGPGSGCGQAVSLAALCLRQHSIRTCRTCRRGDELAVGMGSTGLGRGACTLTPRLFSLPKPSGSELPLPSCTLRLRGLSPTKGRVPGKRSPARVACLGRRLYAQAARPPADSLPRRGLVAPGAPLAPTASLTMARGQ